MTHIGIDNASASGTGFEDGSAIAQETSKNIEPNNRSPLPRASKQRELSSSIASNLASARGISSRPRRGQQSPAQISTQTAEGRVLKPARKSNLGEHEMRASSLDEKSTEVSGPRLESTRKNSNASSPIPAAAIEDPFSRFYSTFGNLISTLSAPLAFAGLPLSTEPIPRETPVKQPSPVASRVVADSDLARYFSKAALRAVRDEQGGLAATESFYVVPPTGGTMSYAGMLSHTRRSSNITEDDEAEFVDASETPHPPSPGIVRSRTARARNTSKPHGYKDNKTWEEMLVENETLKSVVLDLGERLRAFELGAQRSSRALHASVRGLSSPSGSVMTTTSGVPPIPGAEGMKILQDKLQQNEEELKTLRKDSKRLTRENTKLMSVIERYRERWEVLKEGARERVRGDPQSTRRRSSAENVTGFP